MGISVNNIGTNYVASASVGSAVTLTGVTLPAGSLIVVLVNEFNTTSFGTMSDGVNTYQSVTQTESSGPSANAIFYAYTTGALSSATISYTKQGGDSCALSAVYATGISPSNQLDTNVTTKFTSSAANPPVVSLASGAPSMAGELFIALLGGQNNGTNAFTQDSADGWSSPPNAVDFGGSQTGHGQVAGGYLINSDTGSKVWAPTESSGSGPRTAVGIIVGFKPLAPAVGFNMPMLGM